jgi:glycosyltransferase involved in cell wall biosynthesis
LKQRINFVDSLFSNEGHYIDDVVKYSFLSNNYELHYFINGNISFENRNKLSSFIIHESESNTSLLGLIKYMIRIQQDLLTDDFNFIMSIKYIPLFIYSFISRKSNYFVLIHFFPTIKKRLNTFLLNYLLKKTNGFLVLDTFVKNDLEIYLGENEKIKTIHSRDIKLSSSIKSNDSLVKVSFIGAMNSHKDILTLIEIIEENKYPDIEFYFYSKGISRYFKNSNLKNKVTVKDEYFSNEDYKHYLKSSDFVYLAYKSDYGVRFSGILCDALSNGCQLLCNDNLSFEYYIDKYNVGYIFRNKEELNDILKNVRKLDLNEDIYDDYSREKREQMFTNIVKEFYGVNK